jgi:ATP-binding cassette subfamily B protein
MSGRDPVRHAWPLSRLSEALESLALAAGLPTRSIELPGPPTLPDAPARERHRLLGRWIESAAGSLDLEAEPLESPYPDLEAMVRGAAPALLRLPGTGPQEPLFLAVLRARGRRVQLLGPGRTRAWVPAARVAAAMGRHLEQPLVPEVDRLLERAGVPERRRPRAREAILGERLRPSRVGGCWQLRLPPGQSFWRQMARARLPGRLAGFLVAHLAQYLLMILSWWVIGNAALSGHFDRQWLLAWILLLVTQVPLGVLVDWVQGTFAIGVGGLLKLRLLHGALRLEPEETRTQGAGQLLGRVIESDAVESLALSAGFTGLMALIELVAAAAVLLWGPGGWVRLLSFLGWVCISALLARRYLRQRLAWTEARLDMTNDLVERMVGHRTRLAQQRPEQWHDGEDQLLSRYLDLSRGLDRTLARFLVLLSRGWIVVGVLGMIPLVVTRIEAPLAVAIALGGVLMASRALASLAQSLSALTGALVAWKQVAPLYHAAGRAEPPGSPEVALSLGQQPGDGPVLEARDLSFAYRRDGRASSPVIEGCSLTVRPGDRLLLEGPSGGGKTTLASLLVGLRRPGGGLLLLRGLDRQTLGTETWRRRVVAAPQFHENHVMTGTFAFNLLMGRRWPAEPEDMEEAERVCRELGLGPLLERMPAGLLQVVGETGWRLSHGEQSRLFIARALLQGAELMVLDESFAALDPGSLRQSLECVLRRAPALLVIAHP